MKFVVLNGVAVVHKFARIFTTGLHCIDKFQLLTQSLKCAL